MAFLGGKTYSVTRYAAGDYVDGDWVNGASSVFSAFGTLRPLTEKERLLLPEAVRAVGVRKFYTSTQLRVTVEDSQIKGDRITDGVDVWEVTEIADNTSHVNGIPHYRYHVTRVGDDEP